MGIGPFSSESTTRLDHRNTAFNTGFSEISGPATSVNLDLGGKIKVGKGGRVNPVINLTDQGAINAAMALNDKGIRAIEQSSKAVADVVKDVVRELRRSGEKAVDAVVESNRGEVENISLQAIKYGALALAAFLVVRAFTGSK